MIREYIQALSELPRPGEHVYLVGGCVRDLLLGRETKDIDVVTDGNPRKLAERVARRLGGAPFAMHTEMRAYRVAQRRGHRGIPVDVLPLTEDLNEDLLRRDFSINALALPVPVDLQALGDQVVDPAGGVADLEARCIRHVRPDVFTSDPIRLLRAVRIAGGLGFSIAPETEALIRESAPLLAGATAERVRDELFQLLALSESAACLRRLDDLGLLTVILPELEPLKGLEQNANHHLDVWEHTLEVLVQLEALQAGEGLPEDLVEPVRQTLAQPACTPRTRGTLVRLAALLHDVAKPQTRGVTPQGVITFWHHDEAGAEMTRALCQRLRLSGREARSAAAAVRGHLAPGFLSVEEPPSLRSRYRFFREMGANAVETLILSLADRLAARGPWATEAQIERHRRFVVEMLRLYFAQAPLAHPVLPIDGQELMQATGLRSGKKLGAILDALDEAVAIGEVNTRQEAIDFARAHLRAGSRGNDAPAQGPDAPSPDEQPAP